MPIRRKHLVPAGRALRLLGVIAAVALVTATERHLLSVNSATAAFSYLLLVLALATKAGLEESILASVAGMFCYNYYFLPPIGTLTIADPQNWVALVVFLITAITASHLSTSARRRAEEASARRQEMERIYEFSRALLVGGDDTNVAGAIPRQIAEVFGARSVSFQEQATGATYQYGEAAPKVGYGDEPLVPVSLGGHHLGSLSIRGSVLSEAALAAIAQLVALALERVRAQAVANRAEAMRQNEQLKSTLLDALAHEFKTPLTSIKAATSMLLTEQSAQQTDQDLLAVIDEESDRLNHLVTESIEVARIAAGSVRLSPQLCSVSELVGSAISRMRTVSDGRPIIVEVDEDLPLVEVDEALCGLTLRQLLGNALKYAPPQTPIRIRAQHNADGVAIHVSQEGPGIPEADQEAIFEKFFRGKEWRGLIPGSGLGLTIAREIVQTHGGRIWVESAPGQGVEFSFTLPIRTAPASEKEKESVAQ